jgi:hypothetical protein
MNRSISQKHWDYLATLSLLDCANRVYPVEGNLKIQKLGFIFELVGRDKGIRSGHYRFFRYQLGPYSKSLANDVKFLKDLGFLNRSSNQLTNRGKFLIDYFLTPLSSAPVASESLRILNTVCEKFGRYSGNALRGQVYNMEVKVSGCANRIMKVRDIPFKADILDPVMDRSSREIEPFPDDMASDLTAELSIPAADLSPENPTVRNVALNAIQRALSHPSATTGSTA